jgi:hypothetical protein
VATRANGLLLTMNLPPRHFANCAISPTRAQTQVTVRYGGAAGQ